MALRIVEALDAYLRAAAGGTETAEQTVAAFEELKRARADMTFADDKQVKRAKDAYNLFATNDMEVDDGALTSVADDGVWVQGWFWLPEDQDTCRECGEPNDNGEGYDGLCGNCADKEFGEND